MTRLSKRILSYCDPTDLSFSPDHYDHEYVGHDQKLFEKTDSEKSNNNAYSISNETDTFDDLIEKSVREQRKKNKRWLT